MKKYLKVTVTRKDSSKFENPLMLSEVRLITKLLYENLFVRVIIVECSNEEYESIFGTK